MGGGDLNSKKSWHPNTMKNQERVWKAEQAAAEEKKRILELQHERVAERDRADLNDLVKRSAGGADSSDDRLHWMYHKPDKKGQAEDYLLGKSIEKGYDQPEKSDDIIPAVARRVVGSSMMTSTEDTQVDLARKMREDPLLLVKERERAARAALLNNPLHRKRIADLLRKEQEQQKSNKTKKSKKKDKDLDSMLAAKLNALSGEKGVDVAALLASDDSSSSSESDENTKKKKKKSDKKPKKSKKAKKKKSCSESDLSDDSRQLQKKDRYKEDHYSKQKLLESTKILYSSERASSYMKSKIYRSGSSDSDRNFKKGKKQAVSEDKRNNDNYKTKRSYRSRSRDSVKDLRNKRTKQGLEIQRKRKSSSESTDLGKADKWKKRTKSVSSGGDVYKTQTRKRSASYESERELNKKHGRGTSVERSSKKVSNMRRSRSLEVKVSKSLRDRKYEEDRRKRRSDSRESGKELTANRSRRHSSEEKRYDKSSHRRDHRGDRDGFIKRTQGQVGEKLEKQSKSKRGGLSEEERAARLAEMAAAGAAREEQRGRRVAGQRAAASAEEAAPRRPRAAPAVLPRSLEARIHSNRHYIQRNQSHMNEHFARR